MLIRPINWSEKTIITTPAITLKVSEFCNKVWPKYDADAPKIIKTREKPIENKIVLIRTIFLSCSISFKLFPVM